MFRRIFLFVFLAFVFLCAGTPASLQKEIDRLDSDSVLQHGSWGFCVMTADSGKIIAEKNSQRYLIPASTLKILTTGAALGLLGENFYYSTTLEYDGTFDSIHHVIHGNLYIHGSGDPSFYSKYFECKVDTCVSLFAQFRIAMNAKGIRSIDGNIIGDASCFDENPIPDDWQWSDLGQYYGAGTSGLAYKDNSVKLFFNSMYGDSCTLDSIFPKPDGVDYRSNVLADGKKDQALVYGAPFGNYFFVSGTIPPGKKNYEVDASDPEPAMQCAKDFLYELKASGFSVTGKATTVRRMKMENNFQALPRRKIVAVNSPYLSQIIAATNINSDNTYAEQVLRTLGMLKGKAGTEEAGIQVVKNYWSSLAVDTSGLYMTDGCGLARSNGITPFVQATILQKIYSQKYFNSFFESLPVAGKSGSMTSLGKGTAAENNMHAKTGYINRARGYAGYVRTKSGKLLCFSLLANNYDCDPKVMKRKLEKILVAMAELQ
ncbi:MAG: D-alanyl-D-alanine carboxypeptidase/D-alanyl-D-alanine-endopeptidase [Bacteroidetes bacterium]|nr:D-alanyl-D-alanine carboxypeptidase/D-alanyl-D-alanine-endopeptidase [Bacteroidota bacterium]